jgi:hypothetical protein
LEANPVFPGLEPLPWFFDHVVVVSHQIFSATLVQSNATAIGSEHDFPEAGNATDRISWPSLRAEYDFHGFWSGRRRGGPY